MSDVQTLPTDTQSHATPDETNGVETDATETKRKRRGPPDQIAIARSFQPLAPIGDKIRYGQLSPEQRRAVLPTNRMKWLNSELVEHFYNEEMGTLESIRLIPDAWHKNKWQLDPEPSEVTRRTLMSDPKYKLMKMVEENPRRAGSHAWYNWQCCYHDGMSVGEYLRFMDYPRDIKVTSNRGNVAWFNGPASILLNQDVASGYVAIYDSSLPAEDPGYWQTAETFGVAFIEEDDDVSDSAESETPQQGGESGAMAA